MREIALFEEMINTDVNPEKVLRINFNPKDLEGIKGSEDISIVLPGTLGYKSLNEFKKEELAELLKLPVEGIINIVPDNKITIIKNNNTIEDEIKSLSRNSTEYLKNKELLSYIQKNVIELERNVLKD